MELYTLYNCSILFPIYLLYKQNGRFLQYVNNFIKEAVQKVINRNTLRAIYSVYKTTRTSLIYLKVVFKTLILINLAGGHLFQAIYLTVIQKFLFTYKVKIAFLLVLIQKEN